MYYSEALAEAWSHDNHGLGCSVELGLFWYWTGSDEEPNIIELFDGSTITTDDWDLNGMI